MLSGEQQPRFQFQEDQTRILFRSRQGFQCRSIAGEFPGNDLWLRGKASGKCQDHRGLPGCIPRSSLQSRHLEPTYDPAVCDFSAPCRFIYYTLLSEVKAADQRIELVKFSEPAIPQNRPKIENRLSAPCIVEPALESRVSSHLYLISLDIAVTYEFASFRLLLHR